ncbi:FMN reductase [Microbacterium sediminicola]|uniref:FMN reductase n=1 Tax=Microbacterium sediminicola TaxID=415210 RepID=A0ABN2I0N5_9MICO
MSARRVAVISAGLSTPSSSRMLADRLAVATSAALSVRGADVIVDAIELRDHAHAITDNMITGFARPELEAAINAVVSADAIIAVTPVFSSSYSGLFKSFIDVLDPDSLRGTPVLLGANGGTPRHSLALDYALRPLFAYLHADVVPTGVYASSADWGGVDEGIAPLAERIERAGRELAEAITRREPARMADPFDPDSYLGEGRSFGHLLGGLAGE